MMEWAWRGKCESCGYVHPRRLPNGASFWLCHHGACPKCGGSYAVSMGQQIWVRALPLVWWNPFTWFAGQWVWEFKKICRLGLGDYFVVPDEEIRVPPTTIPAVATRAERDRLRDALDEIKVYHPYVKCCATGVDGDGWIIHPVIKTGEEARAADLPETLHGIRLQSRFEKDD